MRKNPGMSAKGRSEDRRARKHGVPGARGFGFARYGVSKCRCTVMVFVLALLFTANHAFARNKDKDKGKPARKTSSTQVVDSGTFGIFLNGKRIGTEKFNIEQHTDMAIITAEIKVDDGTSRSEQSSEMRVGGDGKLKLYK